jgi:Domain of unknown function (DUF932)
MTTLTQASRQWMSRPHDERFLSLYEMADRMRSLRERSHNDILSIRRVEVQPDSDHRGLLVNGVEPTHQAFSQLCTLASPGASPSGYFRDSGLPAEVIADCLNYNLRFGGKTEAAFLATDDELRAVTGPNYGRIWNADIVDMLIQRFGDGVSGDWRVPGEFGRRVEVDRRNTTLYASDRDMFVFLADEERRIEVPARRDGQPGSLARGFFVWNSEVGDKTLGAAFFLFDYVCSNRMVWGADQYTEVRIRHTKGAPDRWLDETVPVLNEFAQSSAKPIEQAIEQAREKKLADDLDQFLANRFGRRMVEPIKAIHLEEEGRPIETVWDATVAATAHARSIPNTDKRVEIERAAGELLKLAA